MSTKRGKVSLTTLPSLSATPTEINASSSGCFWGWMKILTYIITLGKQRWRRCRDDAKVQGRFPSLASHLSFSFGSSFSAIFNPQKYSSTLETRDQEPNLADVTAKIQLLFNLSISQTLPWDIQKLNPFSPIKFSKWRIIMWFQKYLRSWNSVLLLVTKR